MSNCRDRLLWSLHRHGLATECIAPLLVSDVVVNDERAYLEAVEVISVPRAGRAGGRSAITVDADLHRWPAPHRLVVVVRPSPSPRNSIEDYLNAAHSHGRPFVDYRPDIGVHLFPSAKTGGGLNRRTVSKIILLLQASSAAASAAAAVVEEEEEGEDGASVSPPSRREAPRPPSRRGGGRTHPKPPVPGHRKHPRSPPDDDRSPPDHGVETLDTVRCNGGADLD